MLTIAVETFWHNKNRPVGQEVMRSSLEWEGRDSNLRPLKLDTVLPTTRHHCNISLKGAVLPERNDAKNGPTNPLHASVYYSKYNEKFNLISIINVKFFMILCKYT